jgi:ABC-type Fe3+-hydroxamate transport system substrate-binding protein
MPCFTDQTGHTVQLSRVPERIVSIVPSQSEFLWHIGAGKQLAGITKFCIHPEEMFRSVARVGGTKKLDLEKIRVLKPDLIIGNKEENEKEQIETLRKEFNVWMSDIFDFADAFAMMLSIGEMTGKLKEAEKLVETLKQCLPEVKNIFEPRKTLYFIWKDPYMLAAGDTFIHHVLRYTGLKNGAAQLLRYPKVTEAELKAFDPELCLLSSEPFPFKQMHAEELKKLLPKAEIRIVDGEVFSWYGSRLLELPEYLKQLKKESGQ